VATVQTLTFSVPPQQRSLKPLTKLNASSTIITKGTAKVQVFLMGPWGLFGADQEALVV
jgi:hypothetical protein